MVDLEQLTCISLKPHYAEAIFLLGKNVENRTWSTKHRGLLGIHSSSRLVQREARKLGLDPHALTLGAVIGVVELVRITERSRSKWAVPDNYHWVLANARRLAVSLYTRGKLNLFTINISKSKRAFAGDF